MFSWVKYLLMISIFIVSAIMVVQAGFQHESNVHATQEVQGILKSSIVGELRENSSAIVDKKSVLTNLIIDIARSEKENGNDIQIDYVFLDSSGQITEDEHEIAGIQYVVKLLKDGDIKSSSTERIMLSKLFQNQ